MVNAKKEKMVFIDILSFTVPGSILEIAGLTISILLFRKLSWRIHDSNLFEYIHCDSPI